MGRELSLFIGTFTTLLAIINPFEVLPVYFKSLQGERCRRTSSGGVEIMRVRSRRNRNYPWNDGDH